MIEEKQVPKRIRRMRIERQLTQQEVADKMGVTKGYISRIENSETAPPVGTLISLAQTLGVEFNAFFDVEESEIMATLTPADERPHIAREKSSKIKFAHLAMKFPNRFMEPYLISILEGGRLSQKVQHKGQELWFILKGEIEARIGDNVYILKEGDSLYFNSGYTHHGRCLSEDGGEILAVVWDSARNNYGEPETKKTRSGKKPGKKKPLKKEP
jgi:transcriptional regulator with XRE-family HTH domain